MSRIVTPDKGVSNYIFHKSCLPAVACPSCGIWIQAAALASPQIPKSLGRIKSPVSPKDFFGITKTLRSAIGVNGCKMYSGNILPGATIEVSVRGMKAPLAPVMLSGNFLLAHEGGADKISVLLSSFLCIKDVKYIIYSVPRIESNLGSSCEICGSRTSGRMMSWDAFYDSLNDIPDIAYFPGFNKIHLTDEIFESIQEIRGNKSK